MKLVITFIGLSLIYLIGSGQVPDADSLKRLLSATNQDTNRVIILRQLAYEYALSNPDTTVKLFDEAIKLANKLHYSRGEFDCRAALANFCFAMGDFSTSIRLCLENKKLAEGLHDNDLLEYNNAVLASSYRDQGDYSQALNYSLKGTDQSEKFYGCRNCGIWNAITASIYMGMGRLDSAMFYLRKTNQYSYEGYKGWVNLINGRIYAKMSEYDSAYKYYQISIKNLIEGDNLKDLAGAYHSVAELYAVRNNFDSTVYYSQKALSLAQKHTFLKEVLESSLLLSRIYEKINIENALYYYKTAMVAKDSLFNLEKIKQLISYRYNEELRQQELKAAQAKYNTKVKLYTLLAGLAILFVIAGGLLRNNRHKQRAFTLLQKQNTKLINKRQRQNKLYQN